MNKKSLFAIIFISSFAIHLRGKSDEHNELLIFGSGEELNGFRADEGYSNTKNGTTFRTSSRIGIEQNFPPTLGADFGATCNITFTYNIDNVRVNRSDNRSFTNLSIYYHFIKREYHEPGASGQEILDENSDTEGVSYRDNKCPETSAGVNVDYGDCPPDLTEDVAPDYRDKEPNTPKNIPVKQDGVTTMFTQVDILHNPVPDQLCIPEKFKVADKSHDCNISIEKIDSDIEDFLDGEDYQDTDKISNLSD